MIAGRIQDRNLVVGMSLKVQALARDQQVTERRANVIIIWHSRMIPASEDAMRKRDEKFAAAMKQVWTKDRPPLGARRARGRPSAPATRRPVEARPASVWDVTAPYFIVDSILDEP